MVSDTIRRGAVRPLESIALGGMGPDPLPRTLVPMKATSGPLPIGDDWTYEIKWDGMRALAFVDDGTVRVQSYNERDVTVSWPERSEEHTSELQSLMRISYAVFCLKKKKKQQKANKT